MARRHAAARTQTESVREVGRLDNPALAASRSVSSPAKSVAQKIKDLWREHLDQFAPPGISTDGIDDINDAYRHYMSGAELTRVIGGDLTFALGDLNEKINNAYSPESTQMDYANNDAGIAAGRVSDSGVESAIAFISDVIEGKVKVIDPVTGEVRETSSRDLPERYDGDALEERYRGDKGETFGDPADDGGTLVA